MNIVQRLSKFSEFLLHSVLNYVQILRPCSSVGVDVISYNLNNLILSSIAKLRKATIIRFVMSVCLAVCPHEIASLATDGFSLNLLFENMRAVQKDTELFFKFIAVLKLNQTCLLQSTPLYC